MTAARAILAGLRNTRTTSAGALSGVAVAWIAVHYWDTLPAGVAEALLVVAVAQIVGGVAARDAKAPARPNARPRSRGRSASPTPPREPTP